MITQNVLNAIPGNAVFHSALLSTYSIDFHFMEQRMVSMLRSKGIRNIAVIADARMVEECIETTGGHIKKASELYTLSTVLCNGAFHPKIHIYTGDRAMLLLVGSGNITSGGMGKNQEVFAHVYADENNREYLPVIIQAWHYMKSICQPFKGIAQEQIIWMEQHCTLLRETPNISLGSMIPLPNGINAAFFGNVHGSLWDTVKGVLPGSHDVSKITLASPYFDEEGAFLREIANQYPKAAVDVLLQQEEALLPIKYEGNSRVTFYDWNTTEAHRENAFSRGRFLHGKLLHFKCADTELLIIGSANATSRAFLGGGISNVEVLLALEGKNWLQQLGIYGYSTPIDIKRWKQSAKYIHDSPGASVAFKHKIDSIDKTRTSVKIYLSEPLADFVELVTVDHTRNIAATFELQPGSAFYTVNGISEHIAKGLLYAFLRDGNGLQISNSQIINNSEAIWNTNPSPENRRISNLLSKMSSAEYTELDLFEYFDALHSELDEGERRSKIGARVEPTENGEERGVPTEEARKLMEEHEEIPLDEYETAPRFLTAYIDRIREELDRMTDENTDDEEDGDISTGGGRQQKSSKELVFNSERAFQRAKDRISRVFRKYIAQMRKRADDKEVKYFITQSDHAIFLLCLSHLIAIAGKEQKYMTGKEELKGVLIPYNGAIHEFSSFHSIAFNVIGSFIRLLKSSDGDKQYIHEYDRVRLQYFKELSLGKIITSLVLLKAKTSGYGEQEEKWKKLILLNMAEVFHTQELDIRSIIHNQAKLFDFVVEDLHEAITYVEQLYANTLLVSEAIRKQDVLQNLHSHKLIYLRDVGFCGVEECLPHPLTPKSLKLSNLGFEYNVTDFVGDKVYNISKNKFYRVLQSW